MFSPEDLNVIRRWIDLRCRRHRPRRRTPPPGARPVRRPRPAAPTEAAALRAGHRTQGRAPSSVREAYHLLMRRTDTPALRSWATTYVAGWLARSRHGMDERTMPLPARWGPGGAASLVAGAARPARGGVRAERGRCRCPRGKR
ncbi:hypothetical protein LT493_20650 [Streptomyces tricolor]|nr:hypothetical protein [Streptomyces tricolor]